MKKEILTFTLATAIISLPALAGNMRTGTTQKTSTVQERMEDGSTKSSTTVRRPAKAVTPVRKTKTTIKKEYMDENHDGY